MKSAENATIIGKSVIIRGELTGSEDLFMDGQVDGTITLTDCRLTLGPNARVNADISVQDIIIFGKVDGNIKATGSIDLRQTAIVTGDVFAGRLSIEENALIKGRVELNPTGSIPRPS